METTKMYIELIVVGLETFVWICMFLVDIVGNKIISVLEKILNNFSVSLLLIGILYVIGVLIDRLTDIIFQKFENKIRKESGLQAKTSFIIWKKYNLENFSDYTRSRIRILRASTINIPLIMLSLVWYVFIFYKQFSVIIYIYFIGMLFMYASWKGYKKSLKTYYDKACILELNNDKP